MMTSSVQPPSNLHQSHRTLCFCLSVTSLVCHTLICLSFRLSHFGITEGPWLTCLFCYFLSRVFLNRRRLFYTSVQKTFPDSELKPMKVLDCYVGWEYSRASSGKNCFESATGKSEALGMLVMNTCQTFSYGVFYFKLCVWVCLCLCCVCVYRHPQRSGEGSRSPRVGFPGACELRDVDIRLNLGLLQE